MHEVMIDKLELRSNPSIEAIDSVKTVSSFSVDSLAETVPERSRCHEDSIKREELPLLEGDSVMLNTW